MPETRLRARALLGAVIGVAAAAHIAKRGVSSGSGRRLIAAAIDRQLASWHVVTVSGNGVRAELGAYAAMPFGIALTAYSNAVNKHVWPAGATLVLMAVGVAQ